ncbi:PP2C family protein-serine/threonine phosphatase [Bifidobacterium breve]|uniref:PP2C family protein-serine/threonine phosphatase n=1 Tax=Bifidobacterium breve TaxID=1685 RepID=UPI0022AFA204|nr:PP2C family serine/threonine-protein phosphatase [Bifidobacterium breve]MCZ4443091.1 protein phosphatase 2C domain-containing protein [Bifidobacterium breve]MCZ4446302.1 protein phosphatase 2C domain-containing protein [Bifidobacterium breve]MCZ4451856.1 protein phosphatase 2C domain-containing protein [Bifidobacterium breve]
MPNSAASQPLFLYSTTVSDVGTVRANNQDSSFAGEHLIAICDGMGGHAGGDTASSIAIRSLAHIEQDDTGGDVEVISRMMETSVMAAHDAIVGKAKRERKLAGMGTTVTAVALVAGYWVVAHIGDSRAYLLRDGHLSRITCDHSYVQHLIDTGRITPAEAKNHPQRNVVMRVLGDFDIDPHPDISIRKAHPADRWLLCSDGLCGVLEDSTIKETMTALADQGECAQRLVQMALRAGSTDNVTAVIADATLALDADAFDLPHQTPLVGGAASRNLEPIADIVNEPVATAPALRDDHSPAKRAAALMQPADTQHNDATPASAKPSTTRVVQPSAVREETGERDNPDTGEIPVVQKPDGRLSADPNDPEVAKAIRDEHVEQKKATRAKHQRNRLAIVITILLAVAVLFGAGTGTYMWSQTRYYVGNSNGKVAIYQGVPTNLFGLALSHEVSSTSITVSNLPQTWRNQLNRGISVGSLDEAQSHVGIIRSEMNKFKKQQESEQAKKSTSSNSSGSSNSSTSGNTNKSESGIGAADDATAGGSQ